MPKDNGFAPILIILAAAGIIIYLLLSSTLPFKDKLFSLLYPKPSSFAQGSSVPDEILLKFKTGVPDSARENVLKAHGLEIKETIPAIEVIMAKVPEQAKDKVLEALSHNPRIEYAEPNYINQAAFTPNDYYFTYQWNLKSRLNTPAAWDITQGDPALVIAIIDSGVDFNHEELINKGTGALDDYGHGTLVAGAAAVNTNNSVGIAGVCPLCQILSVKVLNSTGSGSDSAVASGIIKASDAGTKVINLSLGGYSLSTTMQSAVDYAWSKGVVLVGAAGNDNSTTKFYPAAFPNVISVGATTSDDNKSSISNYGDWVDVWAPGQGILAPKMGGSYTAASGTSLASPHVAGLAGLILSAKPGLTNQQVVDLIISNIDDLGGVYNMKRINAYKALSATTGIVLPPADTTAPSVSITAPTGGSTVSGLVDITVDATDNIGVTKVEFYVDGILLGSDISSPYVASWDSTTLTNGSSHNISSKAYDLAGNIATSVTVSVSVNNPVSTPTPIPSSTSSPTPTPISTDTTPPTVSITNPTNGSVLKATSTTYIQASALDNISVSKVEFYVNNSLKCTSAVSPYTCSWKVPGRKNASYTLSAKAYDISNNTNSTTVTVKTQ